MIISKKIRSFTDDNWDIILVFFIVLAFLILNLGKGSLLDWDEAIYAQIAREMSVTGNWLVPHWQNVPWFEKPPLYLWSTATFFRLFGISELTARLSSSLAGAATVALTFQIGKELKGRLTGLLAALVLLTSQLFVFQSRFGTVDVVLCFFMLLACYGLFRLQQTGKPGYWFVIMIASALAVMTKGVGAVPVMLLIGLVCIFDVSVRKTLRSRPFLMALTVGTTLVLPWHLFMYLKFHSDFIASYLGYHVIDRVTGLAGQDPNRNQYYLQVIYGRFYPWAYLLPISLAFTATKLRSNFLLRSLIVFSAIVFGIFTLSITKLDWYILPIMPALAVIIGFYLDQLVSWRTSVSAEYNLLFYSLVVMSLGLMLTIGSKRVILLILIVVFFGVLISRLTQHPKQIASILLLCMFFWLGSKQLRTELHPRAISPIAIVGQAVAQDSKAPSPMLVYKDAGYGPAQIFYTNHTPAAVRTHEDLLLILNRGILPKNAILNLTAQDQERNNRLANYKLYSPESWLILMTEQDYIDLKSQVNISVVSKSGELVLGRVSL